MSRTVELLRRAWSRYREERADRIAAALAYHSVFSLAPLFMLAAVVSTALLRRPEVRGQLLDFTARFLGDQAASAVDPWLRAAHRPRAGWVATIVGLGAMLFGASRVFLALQDALNSIFRAPASAGLRGYLHRTAFASVLVLAVLIGLAAAPAVNAALSWMGRGHAVSLLSWIAIDTALFAAVFRFLPDIRLPWSALLPAAALTSLAFTAGQALFGWYLHRIGWTSIYGASASLAALLLWVYIAAQLVLLGAAFAHACLPASELGQTPR